MKKLHTLLLITVSVIAASCSSTYQAGKPASDDIYYSSSDPVQPAPAVATYPATPPAPTQEYPQDGGSYDQSNSTQSQDAPISENPTTDYYQDGQGNTYVTNNYYNEDYYDYSYSSRLRRYYEPAYGYGYYDPYYTNSYYYDYYPNSWGVSIYSSYGWWAPSFYYSAPFCYGGFGISIGYGYSPWYSPYYYSYPGSYYHGYNHGYNDGYYHGYNDGYYGNNPYYYNSYDGNTTYHYGARGGSSSNSPRPSGRQNSMSPMTLGEKYEAASQEGRIINTNTPEQIRTGESRDQKAGGNSISNPSNNSQERNTPSVSPTKSQDTRGNTIQRPVQTPSNSGEIKDNTIRSNDDVRQQQQIDTQPSRGATDSKGQPTRTNPAINDTRTTTPTREGVNKDTRSIFQSEPQGTGGEKKSTQPERISTPTKTQPSTPNQERQPSMQQENKNQNPQVTPRKREPEAGNTEQKKQTVSPITSPSSESKSGERTMSKGKENQYQSPSREKNTSKTISPRQDSRTPMVQPRNEPRQYKQENNSSPQRSSSPSPSRPSQNQNNSNGGSRR